jgi:3-deoxy-manno-octulosonate cytidylyltransferase (CMP-KDO synthetase)
LTATVVIPARLASTRFPAKIVAAATGRPLVQHVVDQVQKCKRVRQIIVAADDLRIVDALRSFDTRVVMTNPNHPSGTDRLAEVAQTLTDDVIMNVQGDEPDIEPETIDGLIELLGATNASMATAATPFRPPADPKDPNLVKVVMDPDGRAIYFSRSPIPYHRDSSAQARYDLHVGVYAYARPFLIQFASWQPTPLEQAEKLEQLRAIEHGVQIAVLKVDRAAHGIDTPQQYDEFVRSFRRRESA